MREAFLVGFNVWICIRRQKAGRSTVAYALQLSHCCSCAWTVESALLPGGPTGIRVDGK